MPGFEHHVSVPFNRDAVPYRVRIQAVQTLLLGPVARQATGQAHEGGAPGA